MADSSSVPIPTGFDFLDLVAHQERDCEAETRERRSRLGTRAPQCAAEMGTVLSLLDRVASCFWGCAGGDHFAPRMIGRAVSSSRASLRLLSGGYYDESLVLTRSVGETANLLSLFQASPDHLATWRADERARKDHYSPYQVRMKLEALGAPVPISRERYSALSGLASHLTPTTRPQSHNPLDLPTMGARFQQIGYLLGLNELALALSCVALFGVGLAKPPKEQTLEILHAGKRMMEAFGGVNVEDGVPRLTDDARAELHALIEQLPESERLDFVRLLAAVLERS